MNKTDEKVVGILGGMGPEATVDIFKKIVSLTNAKTDQEHLHIIIDNNPKIPDRTESIITGDRKIVFALVETAKNLEKAGSDFIIIPCNTAHYFIYEIEEAINIPIINMIKETVKEVIKSDVNSVGLLATTGTIQTGLYQNELKINNISFMLPDSNSQETIMDAIMKIKAGVRKEIVGEILYREAIKLIKKGADALILGCTEIPLAFPFKRIKNPVFDATTILAYAAIRYAKGEDAIKKQHD